MNGWVVLALNSLILTGRTLRTFSSVVSECLPLGLFQEASATRSPLKDDWPEVTLKVALTLAPGATGSENVDAPEATAVQPLSVLTLSLTPIADSSVLLVKVTVVGDEEPGVKVCTRGGRVDRRRRRQAYGLHGILARNDVRLDQLVGGVCREGVGSGDGALVERALRADAVIAAVAEQNEIGRASCRER